MVLEKLVERQTLSQSCIIENFFALIRVIRGLKLPLCFPRASSVSPW